MTALWWVLLVAVLLGAAFLWLAVFKIGTGINARVGPHPVRGRVVAGSPFGDLVRIFRGKGGGDPASGVVVFGRAHFAGDDAGPYLVCHELGHLVRAMAVGRFRHTWRYLTDAEFRQADEEWAHQFALDYQSDGTIRWLYTQMADDERERTGTVTPVAG